MRVLIKLEKERVMFLRKTPQANGRIFLAIVKGYRDPVTKTTKAKTIESIGFLDELEKIYPDPIAHFTEKAKQMTEDEKRSGSIQLTVNTDEIMTTDTNDMKNIGFMVLSKIYHELGIHKFMINRERGLKAGYPLNKILKLIVFDRILHPSSKLSSYENRDMYLENFDFPLESVYRSLAIFAKHKDRLILDIHQNVVMKYNRDVSNVFYDVTNYYYHTEDETNLIAKGYSKDRKGKPIIQMGLLLDKTGLPMTYKLFRGNTSDPVTLLPILSEVKKEFNLARAIVVADKALNSGDNKAYNIIQGDGYIYSRSLRGTKADNETKAYALDEKDYRWIDKDHKIKSRIYPTDIGVTNEDGNKVNVSINEKHVVFYSAEYDRRSKHKRNELLSKASELIESPSRYAKAESYGAFKYIKGMKLDRKTGELSPAKKDSIPMIDMELVCEEEKYDGYYSIVTSELDMPDFEVVEKYKGLWKIEETFKLTKSLLKARPVYLKKDEHIEAHFLTCFIALLILRILERKTGNKYSTESLIESIKKANVVLLDMNNYKAVYYDKVLEHIDANVGTKLSKKYLSLEEIKTLVAETKQKK